jgi:hypothetical protein
MAASRPGMLSTFCPQTPRSSVAAINLWQPAAGQRSAQCDHDARAGLMIPCAALPVTARLAPASSPPFPSPPLTAQPSARGRLARLAPLSPSSYGKLDAPASPTATTHCRCAQAVAGTMGSRAVSGGNRLGRTDCGELCHGAHLTCRAFSSPPLTAQPRSNPARAGGQLN